MPNAEVVNFQLANTVVFPESTIKDSQPDRAIVDDYASLSGVLFSQAKIDSYTKAVGEDTDT